MKNRHYLNFVRSLPCAICEATPVQAHHEIGSKTRGTGIKANDFRAIPLCVKCHYELHAGGHKTWEKVNGITQSVIIVNTLEKAIARGALKVDESFCF